MTNAKTLAEQISLGDADTLASLNGFIRLKRRNLVERPWGGLRMLEYKGSPPLPDQKKITGLGIGEAFELASYPSDAESDAFPSIVCLPDSSEITLPQLMEAMGEKILGTSLFKEFGGEIPLLPKTLDIEELLSVQAHPPGNTELYIIIDAEPGASIRLGFSRDVNPAALQQELIEGRLKQEQLLELLRSDVDHHQLHCLLAPAMADKDGNLDTICKKLLVMLHDRGAESALMPLLQQLKSLYWKVLNLMNEIPVAPGQIIYNATPAEVCAASGVEPSAEVHALGNPEQKEILMLEIRRPGITFRAWDNVRFPIRDIDIEKALAALNCGATCPKDFNVIPKPDVDNPDIETLVDGENFRVERIKASPGKKITVRSGRFHTLHAIKGTCALHTQNKPDTSLRQGETVIVPVNVAQYVLTAVDDIEVISVSLPDND